METFVDWLESEIKARDWRPADLAQRAGITDATLSRILSGSRQAGIDVCLAMADAFGVSREEVLWHRGWLDPLPPQKREEARLLHIFRRLNQHDQQAVLRIMQSLAGTPSPPPISAPEVLALQDTPQFRALREAMILWNQGEEIQAFWPIAQLLSPEQRDRFEAFLKELLGESESEKLKVEGGD